MVGLGEGEAGTRGWVSGWSERQWRRGRKELLFTGTNQPPVLGARVPPPGHGGQDTMQRGLCLGLSLSLPPIHLPSLWDLGDLRGHPTIHLSEAVDTGMPAGGGTVPLERGQTLGNEREAHLAPWPRVDPLPSPPRPAQCPPAPTSPGRGSTQILTVG